MNTIEIPVDELLVEVDKEEYELDPEATKNKVREARKAQALAEEEVADLESDNDIEIDDDDESELDPEHEDPEEDVDPDDDDELDVDENAEIGEYEEDELDG